MKKIKGSAGALIMLLCISMASSTLFAGKAKIYWGNHRDDNTSGIWRTSLDGSGTELVIEGYRPWNTVEEGKVGPIVCMTVDPRNRQVYFGEVWPADMLRRVNHDGSGLTVLWPSRITVVALDTVNNKIYFGNGDIRRANLDMSDVEVVVASAPLVQDLALDVENSHIYWSQGHSLTGMIRRANFDGTGITTIFANVDSPRGIALDVENGKMYWATNADGTGASWLRAVIRRSNLDGTNVEILLRGENAAVAAPLTEYFASPGNIALDKTRGFLYVGCCCRIFKLATDASSCVRIIPDAGGVVSAWGLDIYIPPSGTLITTF